MAELEMMGSQCAACGDPCCPGKIAVDFCPLWQEAETRRARGEYLTTRPLTPSADLPACRDEDPATPASLAAAYPDPPEYQHPEDDDGGAYDMAPGHGGWGG